MGVNGRMELRRSGVVVVLPGTRVGAERRPEPWLARLFRRSWRRYLDGWVVLVRSGYAPPGTVPGNRWGPAAVGASRTAREPAREDRPARRAVG